MISYDFDVQMSPQRPDFNREIWAKLESFVRKHVWVTDEQLIVVTGPVFEEGLETITQGPNVVSIPKRFFKVILDLEGDIKKAIAFLMPNELCNKPFITYATTIDEVEKLMLPMISLTLSRPSISFFTL